MFMWYTDGLTLGVQPTPVGHFSFAPDAIGSAPLTSLLDHIENRMDAKQTARRAVITNGIVATVAVAILTTPEATTQVAVGVTSVLASSLVLLILSRTPWLRSAPSQRKSRRIWFAVGCTALLVWAFFWVPLVTKQSTIRSNHRAALEAGR
jgi:hypothetical protein